MANNDIIRHDDIAEAGVMKPLQDELIATIKILNTLDSEIIKIATDLKKSLANPNTGSSGGLKNLAQQTRLANQALTEREKVINQTRAAEQKLLESVSLESQELSRLRLEIQRVNAENKKAAKEQSITTGAYEKTSLELIRVRKLWKDLAIVQKENTVEGKALKKQLDELDNTLKRVDSAAGQHQRSVGNYASGFSGLRFSINQVTREMPAFVNSAQTGFMAISNNLPILIDEINRLKLANEQLNAEGKKGVPVWKQVVSGLLSWQTLMGVGITLMVTYGKEIGNAIKGLFGFKDATEQMKEAQEALNEALAEGVKRVDALTAAQVRELDFQTKSLVLLAKKRGASEQEIFEIEQEGRKKQLQVLETNLENQQALFSRAIDNRMEMQRRFREDDSEDNKKLLDEAIEVEKRHNDLRDAALIAYESKKSERVLEGNRFELEQMQKLREEAIKIDKQKIKDKMDYYKSLIDEMDKYLDLAKKLEKEIFKAEVAAAQARKKEEEERRGSIVDTTDLARDAQNKMSALQKKLRERDEKQRLADEKKLIDDTNRLIEQSFKERNSRREKEFDREIKATQQRQDALRDLAIKGVQGASDTIAFEERKQAELEAKRIKQQRNQKRQELLFAGLKAYSANVGQNPNTALTKTLKDITVLTSALSSLPAFYEGAENIAESLGKPQLKGKDGYIVRVHGTERVVDGDNNRKIGDLSNDDLADIASLYNKGLLNPTEFDKMPVVKSYDDRLIRETREVKSEIRELNKTLANRPVITNEFDEVSKMISTTLKTKYKTETTRRKAGGYGRH